MWLARRPDDHAGVAEHDLHLREPGVGLIREYADGDLVAVRRFDAGHMLARVRFENANAVRGRGNRRLAWTSPAIFKQSGVPDFMTGPPPASKIVASTSKADYFLSRSHFAFCCSSWSNRLASAR
jgi:hypothetical protein